MSEEDAKAWIDVQFGAASVDRLVRFADLLVAENERQNLIAPSTIGQIWSRHLADSAQLARWSTKAGLWLDIGTGGGPPGMVLALLLDRPFLLVEPRRRRAGFLASCIDSFGLADRVRIAHCRVGAVKEIASIISARAVASLPDVLAAAQHCAGDATQWVLPRGQGGIDEVRSLPMHLAGRFHVEQSLTDPASVILIGHGRA